MFPSNWDGKAPRISLYPRVISPHTIPADLRKAARHLENEIDLKLVAISKVGSSVPGSSGSATAPLLGEHVFDTLALEIEQMLDKLSTINEKMTELRVSGTASTHTLQRHRDILHVRQHAFNTNVLATAIVSIPGLPTRVQQDPVESLHKIGTRGAAEGIGNHE